MRFIIQKLFIEIKPGISSITACNDKTIKVTVSSKRHRELAAEAYQKCWHVDRHIYNTVAAEIDFEITPKGMAEMDEYHPLFTEIRPIKVMVRPGQRDGVRVANSAEGILIIISKKVHTELMKGATIKRLMDPAELVADLVLRNLQPQLPAAA